MVEIRDRLVAVVLAAGLLLGMVGWQAISPWLGIGTGVLALVAASVIYRLDLAGLRRTDRTGPPGERVGPEVSTRRRAAGRP